MTYFTNLDNKDPKPMHVAHKTWNIKKIMHFVKYYPQTSTISRPINAKTCYIGKEYLLDTNFIHDCT